MTSDDHKSEVISRGVHEYTDYDTLVSRESTVKNGGDFKWLKRFQKANRKITCV